MELIVVDVQVAGRVPTVHGPDQRSSVKVGTGPEIMIISVRETGDVEEEMQDTGSMVMVSTTGGAGVDKMTRAWMPEGTAWSETVGVKGEGIIESEIELQVIFVV